MQRTILIIPVYNESRKIVNVIRKVRNSCSLLLEKILVIDDCSLDNTKEIAESEGVQVIRHTVNLGVGAAIRTGLDFAVNENFDVAVIISGDDQHDPSEMERVLSPLAGDRADFVQGSRFLNGGATIDQTILRKFFTKLYPLLFYLLTGKKCSDITNGFRAFRIKQIYGDPDIDLHQEWLNRYELEVYLIYKVYNSKKYRKVEVPISIFYHRNREERTKMKPFIDWWRIFRPMIFLKLRIKK